MMRIVGLLAVALLLVNVYAEEPAFKPDYGEYTEEDDSEVVPLNEENFDELVFEEDAIWMVKFYAPTCGICKIMKKDWDALAEYVIDEEYDVNIGKINVRENRELSQKYNIGKLPGIILFRDGEVYPLPQARNSRSSYEYVVWALDSYEEIHNIEQERIAEEKRKEEEMDAKSNVEVLTVNNFEATTTDDIWFIEFYGPKCGYCKRFRPTWESVADWVNENPQDPPIHIAKIDAVDGHTYTYKMKANPWPRLKMIRDGMVYTYPEPREIVEVEDYIAWATEGYKENNDGEAFEVPWNQDTARRLKSRKGKKKKRRKKKTTTAPSHDEL